MDLYVAHLFRDEAVWFGLVWFGLVWFGLVWFWLDGGRGCGPTTNCKRPQVCPSAPAKGPQDKKT